jgi:hypothetical protein
MRAVFVFLGGLLLGGLWVHLYYVSNAAAAMTKRDSFLHENVTDSYEQWAWLSSALRALRVNCVCKNKQALGSMSGDGYKIACIDLIPKDDSCIVYSLGSNGNYIFENAVHARFPQCTIVTFDQHHFDAPSHVHFVQTKFTSESTITHQRTLLGHKHVSILKVDIEGAEWDLVHDIFDADVYDQIEVEIHKPTVAKLQLMERIADEHFCLADVNPNVVSLSAVELLFVNKRKLIF